MPEEPESNCAALPVGLLQLLPVGTRHWLLALILPPLDTGPSPSTYPVGLYHAGPGVELHRFQPRPLLLLHPDGELNEGDAAGPAHRLSLPGPARFPSAVGVSRGLGGLGPMCDSSCCWALTSSCWG